MCLWNLDLFHFHVPAWHTKSSFPPGSFYLEVVTNVEGASIREKKNELQTCARFPPSQSDQHIQEPKLGEAKKNQKQRESELPETSKGKFPNINLHSKEDYFSSLVLSAKSFIHLQRVSSVAEQ